MQQARPALFRGRHFDPEIIATSVRWYLRFSLSLRNVEELMAERGLEVDHTTVWRWCQKYGPVVYQRDSEASSNTKRRRGKLMRPTFALAGGGCIYSVRWTVTAIPSISIYR
jgi:transposase-like protein